MSLFDLVQTQGGVTGTHPAWIRLQAMLVQHGARALAARKRASLALHGVEQDDDYDDEDETTRPDYISATAMSLPNLRLLKVLCPDTIYRLHH